MVAFVRSKQTGEACRETNSPPGRRCFGVNPMDALKRRIEAEKVKPGEARVSRGAEKAAATTAAAGKSAAHALKKAI